MELRNTKTQWLALGAMALAVAVFAVGPAVVWALEPGTPPPSVSTPKDDSCCDQKAAGECKETGMHAMHSLAEFNKVLANAKALAEKGDAKGAATEIAKAEDLMKEGHSKMAAKLTERRGLWEKLYKDRLSKVETLLKDIQGVQQNLAAREDAEDLSMKIEGIAKNVQLLRDELTHKGALAFISTFRNPTILSPAGVTGPEGKVVPVVNEKCPMTGNKLDREKAPADLRRDFKGKPVGFCGKECLPAWDKLTDEQKQAKLDKVLPPPAPKKESTVDPDLVSPALYPEPEALPPVD
jgi:hypothetical protein